jgi:ParB family chromosome partitioning protein
MGHARALLSLESEKQIMAAHEISGQGLSVRQTEALVKKLQQENEPAVEKKKPAENVRLNELAGELSIRFATNVAISENAKGKGKITINYDDAETLESILEVLK